MSDTDENLEDIPTDVTTEDDGETSEGDDIEEEEEAKQENKEEYVEEEEEKYAEEEAVEEEEEPEFYDSNLYLSKARVSQDGTLPINILEFHFSYGYDCRKHFNLVVLDGETLCFASGNFINFFSVPTKKIWFRRSALGGGIGHIRKNPNPDYPHFAVAECGKKPIIIVYVWPSLEINCILRGGATRTYTNLDYSPDGELLVSQSGEPDYLITVWDWKKHTILLRNKSYVNDVYRVKFSPYVPGHITTGGVAHIKFWRMVETFTGLKLKGEVGRFGRTEYSDILGVLPMPDEKVVSGCTWGNILIWDAGLITLEVFRSSRKRCHDKQIVQFFYNDGELWSVSQDGHVRVWWYEKIDQADPPDDDRVILLDPSYDFYTPGLSLYCVEKRYPHNSEDSWFYGQDGNGGLWLLDFNTDGDPKPSVLLYKCHAGQVKGMAPCPFSNYLASLGGRGKLFIYNYLTKKLVFEYMFPASGRCLEWLPIKFSRTGDVLMAGFDDGHVRVFRVDLRKEDNINLVVQQAIKPHNKPLTKISINENGSILVTAGEDSRIFVFQMHLSQYADELIIPIGFVDTPDIVTAITWHPASYTTVLLGCLKGQMMQVCVPEEPQDYTDVSFELKIEPIYNRFSSYKSQIRRDIKIRQIEAKKAKKMAKKRKEMERIKKENPGLEIDEEIFLADSDTEEELEPLYYPDVPNKILWLKYTQDLTIWLSVGGYDAGYIYEYTMDQKKISLQGSEW
ncbi:unnamed protein product [Acanthoscelides obtectus]|uniref:Uncharacterized protein n=1 Tax=Acanthoscelides obtectus TaxID=200917 RepID=A0A9P0NUN4_ACAOB|nr:unnamed protein product [Acanthoscelides obtectus]CAK1673891.1 Cilia- and flagella-associated protein 44 [Acanthoscelides obtectus]